MVSLNLIIVSALVLVTVALVAGFVLASNAVSNETLHRTDAALRRTRSILESMDDTEPESR